MVVVVVVVVVVQPSVAADKSVWPLDNIAVCMCTARGGRSRGAPPIAGLSFTIFTCWGLTILYVLLQCGLNEVNL